MKFTLVTKVAGKHRDIFRRFNKDLLLQLSPPGTSVSLVRYDEPTAIGGIVELKVKLWGLVKQEWRNEISDYEENDAECFFVDKGLSVPWPLKSWRHKHLIRKAETEGGLECTEIVDDIEYSAGWLTPFIHPVIWAQFAWRRPQYRKIFGEVK